MFKTLDPGRDIKTQVSSVNEVLIFNGVVFTGTNAGELNVKKFNHWISGTKSGSYYQALYNSNHSSSLAVELLNISYGQSISSTLYTNAAATNKAEKLKMYRMHAKMLLGDEDTRFNISGSDRDDLIFLHFKRSQMKDELKKGSISIVSIFSGNYGAVQDINLSATLVDTGAETRYTQTDRGDVGNLVTGSRIAGQVYYQAGVIVLIPDIFSSTSSVGGNAWSGSWNYENMAVSGGGGTYENMLAACRYRFKNMTVINQANLQSTFYFCRALNDEFNYSSNPTFLDVSQRIIPTSGSNNLQTRTYITKVALLGENGEVLAVASLSQPVKKAPDGEIVVKVRLDSWFSLYFKELSYLLERLDVF